MNMENIERYLQELEAIKNYAQVKEDKERLSQENEQLKVSLAGAQKEVSSLKDSKAKLDDADMTLEEARLDFTRAQDAEVEKRVIERFEKLKVDYEKQMPQMVYQRLQGILKQTWLPKEIADLINTKANEKTDTILRNQKNWPGWFKQIYEDAAREKVNSGLNKEFEARVDKEAAVRTRQKLKEMVDIEWPKWRETHVDPKISELESKIYVGVFDLLKGPWTLTCDQCNTSFDVGLTIEQIEQMVRIGQLKVACVNPACEDQGLFSSHRHTFPVSTRNLIGIYILR